MVRVSALSTAGLAALVLFPPSLLRAQAKVHFGPMAGLSIAEWHGSDVNEVKTRTGLAVGAFLRVRLSKLFQVEPEVLYVQKGTGANLDVGVTGTVKQDFVEFPILLKLAAPMTSGATASPSLFLGPSLGFRTNCKLRVENSSASAEDSCTNAGVALKTTDFSLVFGAGVDFHGFALQGRYDFGLTRVGDYADAGDVKTRAVILTLGFQL